MNMAFTSTSDSKCASFGPTQVSAPPLSVIILTIISFLIAIPMIALSVVNYGMLSILLNSTVAVLALLYHLVFLIVVLIYRKSFSSTHTPVVEQHNETEDDSFDDDLPSKTPSIAFNKWSLIALTFIFLANLIAFCIMVDITTLGALRGTLPAERLGSHKWNITIQKAQTTVLGCQSLTLGLLLGISAWGRRRIVLEEERKSREVQYTV